MDGFPKYLVVMKAGCAGSIMEITTEEEYEKCMKRKDAYNFSAIRIDKEKIDGKEKLWIKVKRVLLNRTRYQSVGTFSKERIKEILETEKAVFTCSISPLLL